MTVPETAVNEDSQFAAKNYNIRFSRKIFWMKTISYAIRPKIFANKEFRRCIFTMNRSHYTTALFFCPSVYHLEIISLTISLIQ